MHSLVRAVEGSECNLLDGAQSLLTTYRPSFVQWEGKELKTDRCMRRLVKAHGYSIGTLFGNDRNTVAVPPREAAQPAARRRRT
eukprot:5685175-Prymnesium_polylepis.1